MTIQQVFDTFHGTSASHYEHARRQLPDGWLLAVLVRELDGTMVGIIWHPSSKATYAKMFNPSPSEDVFTQTMMDAVNRHKSIGTV